MRNSYKVILTSAFILITVAQPANAIFGSECRSPKKSHSNYLAQAKILMAAEDKDSVIRWRAATQALELCRSNPKKYGDKRFSSSLCLAYELNATKKPIPNYYKANFEIQNANQVILNNQKCFKPEQVVEAQRALKLIK